MKYAKKWKNAYSHEKVMPRIGCVYVTQTCLGRFIQYSEFRGNILGLVSIS
jgi:hypothetical protein